MAQVEVASAPQSTLSKKYEGGKVSITPGCDFPGSYPFYLLESVKGKLVAEKLLGRDYSRRFLEEVRLRFRDRGCESEWDDFLRCGGRSGHRETEWAVMELPPHRYFPLHVHPVLEVIHVLQGRLYERRMQGSPLCLSHDDGKALRDMTPIDLSGERNLRFEEGVFEEDTINVNEIGSVHQSFTGAEGCLLLCIWGGGHLNIPEEASPPGYVQQQTGQMVVEERDK